MAILFAATTVSYVFNNMFIVKSIQLMGQENIDNDVAIFDGWSGHDMYVQQGIITTMLIINVSRYSGCGPVNL